MGGRGPAAKPERSRPNDTARREAETTILPESSAEIHGPDLPQWWIERPLESDDPSLPWHPRTLAWWETWRDSGQASVFTDTDWDFLLETASLHTAFWYGKTDLAAELRLRVAKFGATPEDRQRLKIKFAPVESTKPSTEPKKRQRREHRLSLVQE